MPLGSHNILPGPIKRQCNANRRSDAAKQLLQQFPDRARRRLFPRARQEEFGHHETIALLLGGLETAGLDPTDDFATLLVRGKTALNEATVRQLLRDISVPVEAGLDRVEREHPEHEIGDPGRAARSYGGKQTLETLFGHVSDAAGGGDDIDIAQLPGGLRRHGLGFKIEREARFEKADLFRVADGRIVEQWNAKEPVPPADELVNGGKF